MAPGVRRERYGDEPFADQSTGEVHSEAVYQFTSSGSADVFYDGIASTRAACRLIVTNVTPSETDRLTVTPHRCPVALTWPSPCRTHGPLEGGCCAEFDTRLTRGARGGDMPGVSYWGPAETKAGRV
jgi:hypothetical protein